MPAALAVPVMALVFAALLFLPAGRLDWMPGWIYLGVTVVSEVLTWACLLRWNPERIEPRIRFGKGTKPRDLVWVVLSTPVMTSVSGPSRFIETPPKLPEAREAWKCPHDTSGCRHGRTR